MWRGILKEYPIGMRICIFISILVVSLVQLAWNPTSAEILAVLLSDGQILMVTLNGVKADIIAALRTSATAGTHVLNLDLTWLMIIRFMQCCS